MLITCTNKGCMKSSNALLNTETLEVMCEECGESVDNISDTMKRALKSFGQIIRQDRKAFMMACGSCKANREVVMDQNGDTVCKLCHGKINAHAAFKLAVEESGGFEKVDTSEKPKKKTSKKKPTGKVVKRTRKKPKDE